ncbi:hypothetical protein PAECIP111892_00539 [Paenibacillus auburnensis]|uniref:Uncharacterized protein n=1 Tax=Paenibacillus auburnensis TaxID=2905649 RepID=A0ABM9BNJ1_9BACL|nr:hypothetical protein [Paenibacillus auburnensis]CAH1191199.1 hypothetical protein PAECIP111892_00539 [Paenibacillus auburnensis]
MTEQFEMYDDPFKMLILLATLVSEKLGTELKYEQVPSFENETFSIRHEKFTYKKDGTEITWFEFLGRDIASTHDLTRSEYNKMFVECMASLYKL